jgi:hypothetical protein
MTTTTDENQYLRRGVEFLLLLAVLFILSQIAGLAAIYWGSDYARPSWSERSVPPPKLY